MRKLFAALVALFLFAGMVVAVEVTFVKFDKDKKEVTVKVDGKEKTFKVGDKVKAEALEKAKEGSKWDATVEGDTVVALKFAGDKVKVSVLFRGREMAHPEIGRGLLDQLGELLRQHGTIEQAPKIEGRTMTMILAPLKQKLEKEGSTSRGEAKAENA